MIFLQSRLKTCGEKMMDFKQLFGIEINDFCIVFGKAYSLAEIEQLGWDGFDTLVHRRRPLTRLFRYFSYSKDTLNNLENDTVYLTNAARFDDCFDCAVDLDWNLFFENRVKQYCFYLGIPTDDLSIEELVKLIAIKICQYGDENKAIEASGKELDESQRLSIEILILSIYLVWKNGIEILPEIEKVIHNEYVDFINKFNYFKFTCFSTSPYNNRLWASKDNKGFCVEYEIDYKNELYVNLFPVIYSQKRNDFLPLSLNNDKKPSIDDLWQIYFNGLLRKSLHWVDQDEWRLIQFESDQEEKNSPFFKAKKVFIGNKMKAPERKALIAICKEKGIPYVGVIRKPNSFDLMDCKGDCNTCERTKQDSKK